MDISSRRDERVMTHKGVTYANRWAAASLLASVLMLLVSLSSPGTPLWPFILTNWLIFVPGGLLLFRNAKNESGGVKVMRVLTSRFIVALLGFAVCGHIAVVSSNSLIHQNDQLTGNGALR
jgi:hypothetical protein